MIGYDSTNAVAQGLAVREKIYTFSYSYFLFFYRYLPALSLKYNFSQDNDLMTSIAKKMKDYFLEYTKDTEGQNDPNTQQGDKKNSSVLAKYYLAAIYYYEPTYNFKNSSIQEIYELGQIYLLELFKENINSFVERAKIYSPISLPNFSDSGSEDIWKYFVFSMLKAQYKGQSSNIIQQSVSAASRPNEKISFISYYLGDSPDAETEFELMFSKKITHENNVLSYVNLADTKTVFSWEHYYTSILEYIKNSFLKVYNDVIKHFEEPFQTWWESENGAAIDNELQHFLDSIKPGNNFTLQEQNNKYDKALQTLQNAALTNHQFFDLQSGASSSSLPSSIPKDNLILPPGKSLDISSFFDFENKWMSIIPFLNHYIDLLTEYKKIVDENTKYGQTNSYWEDAPTIIKCYIADDVGSYVNTNQPIEKYLKYDGQMFISYYLENDEKTVSYPIGDDINVFFEFSFSPNLERMTSKFGNISDKGFSPSRFEELKNNFILNLSKTETYEFIGKIYGDEALSGLTMQEFSSLFDLNVAILHKITKDYIDQINFQQPLSSCAGTQFSNKKWKSYPGEKKYYRNFLFYNPLADKNKNVDFISKKQGEQNGFSTIVSSFQPSFECDHSVTLGPASDFGINNIMNFNPVQTFKDDNKIYLFIEKIKGTQLETFLKETYNDINPYSFTTVAELLIETKATKVTENFIENNDALFLKSYSNFSKNLLDNLITNVDKVK